MRILLARYSTVSVCERNFIVLKNISADFYGKSSTESRREFKKSLKIYLEVCAEKGINPKKEFSGKFNLRMPPKLYNEIVEKARVEYKSINQWW